MTPELARHMAHIFRGEIRPADCDLCRLTWPYRPPSQRAAYATRVLVFGRGKRDDER